MIYLINSRVESLQINKQIDSGILKGRHATVVISGGVDVVDSDCVGAQFLHQSGVQFALSSINERVIVGKLVGDS
jgi:hypothetical protein